MSGRIRQHLRQNVVGYISLFLVVSGGTAYATHGDPNSISSGDIIDDEVRSIDVRDDSLAGGGLAADDLREDAVGSSEIRDDTLPGGGLVAQDLRVGAVGPAEVRDDTIVGGGLVAPDLRAQSVGTSEVVNGALTGVDIDEASLDKVPDADALDGNDSSAFPRTFAHANSSFAPGIANRHELNATLGALFVINCDDNGTSGVDSDDRVTIGVVNIAADPLQVFVERVNASTVDNSVNDHNITRVELPQNTSTGSVAAKISTYRFYVSPLGDSGTVITAEAAGVELGGGSDNCAGLIQATRSN